MDDEEEEIKKALLKKALGYVADEVVEEYVLGEDGEEKLSKRKVTKKHISPDISAIRVFLERYDTNLSSEIKNMSDEELLAEKAKLIKLLKEEYDGNLSV